MKKVNIYVTASCNNKNKVGRYWASLEYKKKFKYITKELENTTANRAIIKGVIDAVIMLKEPCNITVYTGTPIGILTWIKKRKGTNSDLLNELYSECKMNGHTPQYIVMEKQKEDLIKFTRKMPTQHFKT